MQEQKQRLEFSTTVIEKGGYDFLLMLFTQIEKRNLEKSVLRSKSLILLLQIIPHFFSKVLFQYVRKETENSIDLLFAENLQLLQSYTTALLNL